MSAPDGGHRALLERLAREAMIVQGLEPDFPADALAQAAALREDGADAPGVRDLRALPWCSIDNDESLDLDQLTVAAPLADGATVLSVAVADVAAAVAPGTPLDRHAGINTTSVYTPARIFPMLPDRLSTDLTSLAAGRDRAAWVIEMTVDGTGALRRAELHRALVRNHAKLAYPGLGAWLEDRGPLPAAAAAVPGLAGNLRLQDAAAARLRTRRHEHGALGLASTDVHARFDDGRVADLATLERNRARDLIEDLMIAANGAIASFLEQHRLPLLRRVVRSPERWARIVELAAGHGGDLPSAPDARALDQFLQRAQAADPLRFPDLSLAVVKLMGRGEYVASLPDQPVTGHFGLAVREYTHSTAPNRRYPDLVTQRLLGAALAGTASPYEPGALQEIAETCTRKEDAAQKVERRLRKSAAACLLEGQLGREFDGLVTGASPKGTWVRILAPPVEGRVVRGEGGLDVGDRVTVRLLEADPERGFIDFARVRHEPVGRGRRA
jgi:exoribonuclease II